jgi:long-chain acyl-CoA synthetase
MRLETLLAGHARRRPEHTALVCGAQRLGYAELHAAVRRVACGLAGLGVRPGDRVLLLLPNGVEFVLAQYAAFTLGAIAVPVNPRLAPAEVEWLFADARPAAAVFHEEVRAAASAGLARVPGCRPILAGPARSGEHAFAALAATVPVPLPEPPPDQDDGMILYTSGTTGRPKGALITHANLIVQNVWLHPQEWRLDGDDRFLAASPLAHRAGCARLFNALGLGATLVIMERFDPALALELIERERVTVTGLVPTMIRRMLPLLREAPRRCASLRRLIVSTEAFPVELKREVLELLPGVELHSLFGSTEVLVTNLGHAEQFSHPASVGRPLPGVEVRLVDDAGRDVPAGAVGELLVRSGPPGRWATFRGYHGLPEATAEAIRDGWVHTGDLARADAGGYLYIVDRKKDMVLSGGYNIYSREVEQALLAHPAVADAAVIGVPDALYGEAVAAYVERRPGAALDAPALIAHCRTRLADYKKPRHVIFTDALPRNSTGKVLKGALRERAASDLRCSTPAREGGEDGNDRA